MIPVEGSTKKVTGSIPTPSFSGTTPDTHSGSTKAERERILREAIAAKAEADAELYGKKADSITNNLITGDVGGAISRAGSDVAETYSPLQKIEELFSSVSFWTRIAFIGVGFLIFAIGAAKLIGASPSTVVKAGTVA